MKKLFYTEEKETQSYDGVEECTGYKTISVYEIALDIPKLWFEFDELNENSTKDAIRQWLDDNGLEDREYEFIRL